MARTKQTAAGKTGAKSKTSVPRVDLKSKGKARGAERTNRRIAQFTQVGGYKGNTAGDRGFFSLEGSRRIAQIDGGEERRTHLSQAKRGRVLLKTERDRKQDITDDDSEGEDLMDFDFTDSEDESEGSSPERGRSDPGIHNIGMNTHRHKDHTFTSEELGGMHRVFFGESAQAGISEAQGRQVTKNGQTLFKWGSKKPVKFIRGDGHMVFEANAILPDIVPGPGRRDENALSLGMVLKANREIDDEESRRIFTFYSLGDMTVAGESAIREVFERDGEEVDLLKLPHHGSDDNLRAIPDGLVNLTTQVIVSGYTGKSVSDFLRKLKERGIAPVNVTMLFSDNSVRGIREGFNESYTGMNALEEAGVTIARDYRVIFNDDGGITFDIIGQVDWGAVLEGSRR